MKLEIKRNSVESSNVESIGYDIPFKILDIKFKGKNSLYRYLEVPLDNYIMLAASDSKGSFIAQHIKGKFDCVYYEDQDDEVETKYITKKPEKTNEGEQTNVNSN